MKTRTSDTPLATAPKCPCCHKLLDGWTAVGHDDLPMPGDLTVCIYCLEPLAFTEDLRLRRQTAVEQIDFMAMPETQAIYAALSTGAPRQ